MARSAAGDAAGMRAHLERAVSMATAAGKASARCEALARLAVEAARLGKANGDQDLLGVAEDAANQVKAMAGSLSGHPQWPLEADAALATVHMARGDVPAAAAAAQAAITGLVETNHEDRYFDVTLPAGEVLAAAAPPEEFAFARSYMQLELSRIVQGTLDEDIRARWLRGPVGSRLVALAGEPITRQASAPAGAVPDIDADDRVMLQLLTEGMTNREMAGRLGISEQDVAKRLARIIATLGATDRAQATSIAFRGLAPVPADGWGGALMPLVVRVDRHKCIGAGNCITIAPTAFDWLKGDFGKADIIDADSVEDAVLREASFACPTAAIVIEEVTELLPWQLRGKSGAGPARAQDVHVHGRRRVDQPRRGARRRGLGHAPALARHDAARGLHRPSGQGDLDDRRRVLRLLRLAGAGGGGRDRDPAPAPGASPAARLRPQVRIGLHAPTRTSSARTSGARASTRRRASPASRRRRDPCQRGDGR